MMQEIKGIEGKYFTTFDDNKFTSDTLDTIDKK